MIELIPAECSLNGENNIPSKETFTGALAGYKYNFINTHSHSLTPCEWDNNENTVVMELISPCWSELASLVCILCNFKPNSVNWMRSSGERSVVYRISWGE